MEISILTPVEIVSSNIPDNTPVYDKTLQITHPRDQEYKDVDGREIYKRVGDSVFPYDYDANKIADYKVNDIVFKGGVVCRVSSVGTTYEPKQPEDYSPSDSGFAFNGFAYRYSLLKTGLTSPSFTETVNGVTHSLSNNGSGWKYSITYASDTQTVWEQEKYEYDNSYNFIYGVLYEKYSDPTKNNLKVYYNGVLIYSETGANAAMPISRDTVYTVGGDKYRVGTLRNGYGSDPENSHFAIQKEIVNDVSVTLQDDATVYYEATDGIIEREAYCADTADCNDKWIGRSFIFRGGDLYVRTQVALPAETVVTNDPVFTEISSISDFPGYSYYTATPPFKPVDGKRHTYAEMNGTPASMTFTLKSVGEKFDTLALAGLIADTVDVVFKNSDGGIVSTVSGYKPDNRTDTNNLLPKYQTTIALYSKSVIATSGTAEVTLTGNKIRIGTAALGIGSNAGFTNLNFRNEFEDYSPTEKDQWGHIVRVEGYKAKIHSGTVDVVIYTYDMISRLMEMIGGGEVILNGSDMTDNSEPDSECTFASTVVIGRMSNFSLGPNIDNKFIGKTATYSFKIEESV